MGLLSQIEICYNLKKITSFSSIISELRENGSEINSVLQPKRRDFLPPEIKIIKSPVKFLKYRKSRRAKNFMMLINRTLYRDFHKEWKKITLQKSLQAFFPIVRCDMVSLF